MTRRGDTPPFRYVLSPQGLELTSKVSRALQGKTPPPDEKTVDEQLADAAKGLGKDADRYGRLVLHLV
jgi:hypothetical protein